MSKTVSLVLGSGGARGYAHIGIIEVLESRGFEIRSISGSSMGALIGGIYAAGKLDVYTHWVKALEKIDVLRLLDFSFRGNALFKGDRIIEVLRALIGEQNIEDLPISFTAVATDVSESKEVWINSGPLFNAIRASIALPTVFTPYEYHGRKLFDGGVLNPVPIAPTLTDNTDLTIAVSLSGRASHEFDKPAASLSKALDEGAYQQKIRQFLDLWQQKLGLGTAGSELNLLDVVAGSMDTMQAAIARLKLAAYSPDVLIEIPKNACNFYEFYRARELIEIGREVAERTFAMQEYASLGRDRPNK